MAGKKSLSDGAEREAPKQDKRGRFVKGNCGGPGGNPQAKRAAELRAVLFKAVTDGDLEAVIAKMIDQARDGDAAARKELLDRLWGKPAQAVELSGELNVRDPRLAGFTDDQLKDAIGALAALGSGGAGKGGGGRAPRKDG